MDTLMGMRVFARVVESGSFSAAGRELGVAPSSVSRQIGELEDSLGARLFHRTTRKLSLTEAGRVYYARVSRILVGVDEAKLAVAQVDGTPSGILRLTVPTSVGRLHIAPALAAFRAQYPAVEVVLGMTDDVVDVVAEGWDLAVRVGRQRDSSLIARRIGRGRRLVCASPAYLRQAGAPAKPADLADHNCLTFRSHAGSNVWRFRGAHGTVDARVAGSLYANGSEALAAAAVGGLGIVMLPEWLVGIEIGQGRLTPLLPGWRAVPADSPLYAIYAHQRHLPPKVRAFVDFLAARFAADYAWDAAR